MPKLQDGQAYGLEKQPDGNYLIKVINVPTSKPEQCKPQVPNNPIYIGAGAGRGGNPIAGFPKNTANITAGIRQLQTTPVSSDNIRFVSLLWQPDPCIPLRVGAEYSINQNNPQLPFATEALVGITFGVNPSGNVVFINRMTPTGQGAIGGAATMQWSF